MFQPETGARRGRQLLLLTALIFSTGGMAIKGVHLPGPAIASLRSGFAAIALLLCVPASRRNWSLPVLFSAIAYALTLICFATATKLTTSANVVFLQNTAPIYIVLLSAIFLKERPSRKDLVLSVPIAAGLALFFAASDEASSIATNPRLGNILAVLAGVFYAFLVVSFRALSRDGTDRAAPAAALGNLLAFAGVLPFAGSLSGARAVDWLILIYLGAIQIALGYALMTRALKSVPAFEASLLLLLEPVLNPVWTWLVHGERPRGLAIVGGVMILLSTLLLARARGSS